MNAKVLGKIRKLLRLAQQDNAEGVSARSKAEELAKANGVDISTVGEEQVDPGVVREQHDVDNTAVWIASLAWAIAPYAHVSVVRQRTKGFYSKARVTFAVIGRKEDIELWSALFVRSRREIDAEATRFVASLPSYESKRSAGDSFRKGAAAGFGQRLKLLAEEAAQSVQGRTLAANTVEHTEQTGLVLISRELAVQQAEKKHFPKLGKVRIQSSSRSGYSHGHRHGRQMGAHRGNLS